MKFYNASIVTQIPNISGSQVKGIVKVKRTSTTVEEASELTWTTYENFTNMIQQGDSSAKSYYAIDSSWNLCVSTSVITQGEIEGETLREVKIPYRTLIGQYSMPFNYLFTMLQITQNPEYISYLCDMSIENKQIDLMVFDTVQTRIDTITYKYSEMEKWEEEEEVLVFDEDGEPVLDADGNQVTEIVTVQRESDEPEEKEETIVSTTTSNTVTANVTYANTWLMELKSEYTNQTTTEYPLGEDGQEEESDDEEEPEGEEGSWRVDQSTTTKTEIIKNTWAQAGNTENNGTIKENEFLGLWMNETGNPELGAEYKKNGRLVYYNKPNSRQKISPVSDILTSTELMFYLLEQNEDTQNYSTIMRYLLYKYTGRSYGVTQINLDIFKKSDFIVIAGGGSGNRISYSSLNLTQEDIEILYKITYAERGNGTQEQQEYVVSCILNRVLYSGFPNTVREVVFQPDQFQPTRDGAYDRAIPTETTKAAVQNVIQNGDTSQGALYFMTVRSANTESQQRWLRNCIFLFNDADGGASTHNFYTKQEALTELEQYKSYSFNGEFIEIAKACHDFLRENNYFYSSSANKERGGPPVGWENGARDGTSTGRGFPLPTDVLEPESKRYIDCSAYVTWVLMNAGAIGNVTYQYDSRTLLTNPMGFQPVSLSEIQPGDILVKAGHAEIYAGDGKSYSCGSTSSIRHDTVTRDSGATKAFRPNN